MEILIIVLLIASILLNVYNMFFKKDNNSDLIEIKTLVNSNATKNAQDIQLLRQELSNTLHKSQDQQSTTLNQMAMTVSEQTNKINESILQSFINLMNQENTSQKELLATLQKALIDMRNLNETKLNQIQNSMNEKLDKSLNDRLDSSFKQVVEQLNSLYKSIGELNKLSSGVNDLNKTLSNVKTRGIWGEIQLQGILEETMSAKQYETNIVTKHNSNDRVEFAIKIPSKADDSEFIYLPIDSKFPSDIYNKIVNASEAGDIIAIQAATKELEQRIKTEARTIRDKYIDPPNTTDFAIMFLPTESLYAEVLRINGLSEWCQTNCKVVISGPTTITALLNSLRLGFSNLALNKKSKEVLKLLQAVKTQYSTLNELIDKTQKKLNEAVNSTEALKSRTQMIQKKMSKIEELDTDSSNELLGITTDLNEEDY